MNRFAALIFGWVLAAAGCSTSTHSAVPDGGDGQRDGAVRDASVVDGAVETDGVVPIVDDKVYAHSASTLYEVDPNDLTVTTVGDFVWPGGSIGEQMTDIALDDDGNMIGISFNRVYAVDKETAVCTYLADLQGGFNGLSFVEGVGVDPGASLVGSTISGGFYVIDQSTGQSTLVGNYGGGMGSSGDIVFVRDAGAFATVTHPSYATDVLVEVMPSTGQAVVIGETGFSDIWGVAYWAGRVFGFTESGQFVLIDVNTGQGTLVETSGVSFWGAGVTTVAPVVR